MARAGAAARAASVVAPAAPSIALLSSQLQRRRPVGLRAADERRRGKAATAGGGGLGQAGGSPGAGVLCGGGPGGPGGQGGPGGGGLGGHSIGVAFIVMQPAEIGGTTVAIGSAGGGGAGSGAMDSSVGAAGVASLTWSDWHDDAIPVPSAVQGTSAVLTSCHAANVTWSALTYSGPGGSGTVSYQVCYAPTAGGCALGLGTALPPVSSTAAAITGLLPATTYAVAVRALANGYPGPWSSEAALSVPPDTSAPSAPFVSASPASNRSRRPGRRRRTTARRPTR